MISAINIHLAYGKKVLFDNVSLSFTKGNCYGIIGANGAGKSTFLKILSGELEPNKGQVEIQPNARLAMLSQDQFKFNDHTITDTVIMGHKKLWNLMVERNKLYAIENPSEQDGIRAADIEEKFGEMGGYTCENEASILLNNLGVEDKLHNEKMQNVPGVVKVRVLLAQALFGNPDILLLDEPTNDLDIKTIKWLENFLADYPNVAIVVSHDRHFLDAICTHTADVDRQKINVQVGNYSFWYQSSQLLMRQIQDKNKKIEERQKELKDFIARFSANASKSRQATSRKKALEKLVIEELRPSNRRYPGIIFKPKREIGNNVLKVENLSFKHEGKILFENITFEVGKKEKIGFISRNPLAITYLFEILISNIKPYSGKVEWGTTVFKNYLPLDNNQFFKTNISLMNWLRDYAPSDNHDIDDNYIRGFLGKMLFSGEDVHKKTSVLSGGEKMRCMISSMMIQNPNVLILDQPTAHLDLESITKFNESMTQFPGIVFLSSYDHQFMNTVSNRIVEITPLGVIDKICSYDEYLEDEKIAKKQDRLYGKSS